MEYVFHAKGQNKDKILDISVSACTLITVRKQSCGKAVLHLSVILSMGGVCHSTCWVYTPPPADTPLGRESPRVDPPPSWRLLLRTVRILLECILVLIYSSKLLKQKSEMWSCHLELLYHDLPPSVKECQKSGKYFVWIYSCWWESYKYFEVIEKIELFPKYLNMCMYRNLAAVFRKLIVGKLHVIKYPRPPPKT